MPITFETATTAGSASASTSLAVSVPAGTVAGDLLLLFANSNLTSSVGSLSGWTQLQTRNNSADGSAACWYRVATGSESSSYTVTFPGSTTAIAAHMVRYDGVNASDPIRSSAGASSSENVTVSNAPPTPTGVQATDMVVVCYCWAAWSSTSPTGCFPRYPTSGGFSNRSTSKSSVSGTGNYVSAEAVVDKLGATGTYPTTNVTTTSGGSTAVAGTWATFSVALKVATNPANFMPFFL